jgi:hypothetical protein
VDCLCVANYDSQDYGGAILTRPHTGIELRINSSQSCLTTDGQSAASPLGSATKSLTSLESILRHFGVYYGAASLTRGRVCKLQLLLGLASAAHLGSSPAGLMTVSYCPNFRTPRTCRARSAGLQVCIPSFRFWEPKAIFMPLQKSRMLLSSGI